MTDMGIYGTGIRQVIFMAAGSFDQYIFVVPEKNVVVFTAHLKETNIFLPTLETPDRMFRKEGASILESLTLQ